MSWFPSAQTNVGPKSNFPSRPSPNRLFFLEAPFLVDFGCLARDKNIQSIPIWTTINHISIKVIIQLQKRVYLTIYIWAIRQTFLLIFYVCEEEEKKREGLPKKKSIAI